MPQLGTSEFSHNPARYFHGQQEKGCDVKKDKYDVKLKRTWGIPKQALEEFVEEEQPS